MIKSWYYIKDGNKHGPTLEAELKLMASSGKLLPNDLVWSLGMDSWVPAHSIKSLFNKESSAVQESLGSPPLPPPLPFSQINSGMETFWERVCKIFNVIVIILGSTIMISLVVFIGWFLYGMYFFIQSFGQMSFGEAAFYEIIIVLVFVFIICGASHI